MGGSSPSGGQDKQGSRPSPKPTPLKTTTNNLTVPVYTHNGSQFGDMKTLARKGYGEPLKRDKDGNSINNSITIKAEKCKGTIYIHVTAMAHKDTKGDRIDRVMKALEDGMRLWSNVVCKCEGSKNARCTFSVKLVWWADEEPFPFPAPTDKPPRIRPIQVYVREIDYSGGSMAETSYNGDIAVSPEGPNGKLAGQDVVMAHEIGHGLFGPKQEGWDDDTGPVKPVGGGRHNNDGEKPNLMHKGPVNTGDTVSNDEACRIVNMYPVCSAQSAIECCPKGTGGSGGDPEPRKLDYSFTRYAPMPH